jgi:hypothetical protein
MSATFLVGAWAERAVIASAARAPGFGMVDLFAAVGGAAGSALCAVAVFSIIVIDDDFTRTGRHSNTTVAS